MYFVIHCCCQLERAPYGQILASPPCCFLDDFFNYMILIVTSGSPSC